MKILIIADEVWNDDIHGNNVLSNWFSNFDADFAEIYCSPGTPKNKVCNQYFQITDAMMAKSILGKKAGNKFEITISQMQQNQTTQNTEEIPVKFYSFMKSIAGEGIRTIRDLIWLFGRYEKYELQKFIDDFNPDIVFCPRLLTPKLLRLENIVSKMTNAPFVAFTADDEASLKQKNYSPLYWLKRICFRKAFQKHVNLYKHYFMFSEEQAEDYNSAYNISTSTLFKSGNFDKKLEEKNINTPIKLVYAGRLYCNRWKTLVEISKALKQINADELKMTLDIFTQEKVTTEQRKALMLSNDVVLHKPVKPEELISIYKNADIALHVESFDKKYKYATRVSFSTKIIDLMASTCAIIAICWDKHAGFQYLKKNDAAFCISDAEQIKSMLEKIVNNPQLIRTYSRKAFECGKINHNNLLIENKIRNVFEKVIKLEGK
ncbi:MAG TPA: glycosyltransferase family 1 protein [Flavobacteriaceae bacterium]|nr:glycosyltransferase family 1 protein [Flavobacteriaceae bacterium]